MDGMDGLSGNVGSARPHRAQLTTQDSGVAERFNRTLKEQVIYGRVFQNIQDVRSAVAAFTNKYNQQWLVGKLGYRSPAQARREHFQAIAA